MLTSVCCVVSFGGAASDWSSAIRSVGCDSVSVHILYGQKIVRLARENVPNHSRGAGDRIGMNRVYIYGDRNRMVLFY